jgi:hypothetical protein
MNDHLRQRYDQTQAELSERTALAVKHDKRNYWRAAEAAAMDAEMAAEAYRNSLSKEDAEEFCRQRVERMLRQLQSA